MTEFRSILQSTFAECGLDKSLEEFDLLLTQLQEGTVYNTLPQFSRKLRDIISGLEQEMLSEGLLKRLPPGFTPNGEFLDRWGAIGPTLAALSKDHCRALLSSTKGKGKKITSSSNTKALTQGDNGEESEEEEDQEHVEQEGCPDDTDFNKYVSTTYYILT